MIAYYIINKATGEVGCIFGTSWADALRRNPSINGDDWRIEMREWND